VNFFGTTELAVALQPALAASATPRVAVVASSEAIHGGDEALVEACLAGDEDTAIKRAADLIETKNPYVLYPSSKHALARWMRRTCIAPGWADAGIALNAVGPGIVETPMSHDLLADKQMARIADEAVPMPLNGHALARDIAMVLSWLVAPENSHMTGQVVFVDGGADATRRGDLAW
jgi:NAD(P)-dependent dehydrogenase (short-subunit alcohol dehydrogenase family)